MKKRLLKLSSLFLSLAMVLSLFCIASLTSNAETNVIYVDQTGATEGAYTTLTDAVTKAKEDTTINTIMFKSDYTATSAETVDVLNITIDLGGYTYKVASSCKGIAATKSGIVIQNGIMLLDASGSTTSQYNCIFNNGSKALAIKKIKFYFTAMPKGKADSDTNPGGLIRNLAAAANTTNVYDCSFECYSSVTGSPVEAPLVSCSCTSMNFYNCSFDGNGIFSGIQVRGNVDNSQGRQLGRVGLYNCNFKNVNHLFGKSSSKSSLINSEVTIFGATVNNAIDLKAEDFVAISATDTAKLVQNGQEIEGNDFSKLLGSPYSFEVVCAHSFVDGVCEYCYAPEPTAPSVPAITMDSGAAMRIDSKTEGIRFSATVDKDALDGFGYEVTDAGMLVAKESIASTETLTVENSVPVTSAGQTIADGKVVAARYNGVTLKTADDANKYVIFGSLVEISEKNANQKYVARAFIEYTDGEGNTAYLYSDLSDARSIAEVASLIQQDGLAKPDDDTVYYNTLCGTHKDVVDFWAGKYSN